MDDETYWEKIYRTKAARDFEQARRRAFFHDVLAFLTGRPMHLLPFEEVRRRLGDDFRWIHAEHYAYKHPEGKGLFPIEGKVAHGYSGPFADCEDVAEVEAYEWPNPDGLYCKSYCPLHPEVHDVVFALVDETRPRLQGSRLTAWELLGDGVPTTLNVDSAAAHLMKTRGISWVVVGADRIAANGDVANKIGTYQLAVLAMHHGVRFMVVAPSSSIDMTLESGDEIPLEERAGSELLEVNGRRFAADVEAFNPVFDVTPADLIDVIVTEKGVVERPTATKMADLMSRKRLH